MKKRKGFVSNSSSSSFICEVSGEIESGWDMCLSDAEMSECENGHTFLNSYLVKKFKDLSMETKRNLVVEGQVYDNYKIDDKEERKADTKKRREEFSKALTDEQVDEFMEDGDFDDDISAGYGIPAEMCPICSFSVISDGDAVEFLMSKYNTNKDKVKEEIKGLFKDYKEFRKFLTIKE